MRDRFGFSIGGLFAAVIPFACGLIAVALANIPVSLLGGLLPAPMLALMPIYFWCLLRPDLLPLAAIFTLGVLQDLLSGGPPGVWAASFLAGYAFVERQRDALAGLAGLGAILGFAAAMLIACATAWCLTSLYYWRLLPAAPLMIEFGVSVFWYIPAVWLMNRIQHRFIGPLRSDF